MKLVIGTRGSDLALWQARYVRASLEAAGHEVRIEVLVTRGDRIDDVPLQNVEGKAFFTKEIEDALLDGRVDVAVHSHKDLAVDCPSGLAIAAVPPRANPGERLLARRDAYTPDGLFLPLASGARVGTSSPRRRAQIAALRPDVELLHLRGNVPTRVERLREGRYDSIVLACAGLDRLELDLTDLEVFDVPLELLVPAPAQGALAIQCREGDAEARRVLADVLHDEPTASAVRIERAYLTRAGGGCNLALGAVVTDRRVILFRGPDATDPARAPRWWEESVASAAPERGDGTPRGPLAGLTVALTGASGGGTSLGTRLASLGAEVRHEGVLETSDIGVIDSGVLDLHDLVAVTSRRAVPAVARALATATGVRVAAVGPATADALREHGIEPEIVGTAGARALADALDAAPGTRVLFPCAEDALDELERALAPREVEVTRVPVYRTAARPGVELDPRVDARVYMAPSAVHASLDWERSAPARATQRIALGEATARTLAESGLDALETTEGTREGVVRLLATLAREASKA